MMEESLEIKRRSWEARVTQNGKKEKGWSLVIVNHVFYHCVTLFYNTLLLVMSIKMYLHRLMFFIVTHVSVKTC